MLDAGGIALHAVGTEIAGGHDARYSGMGAGFIWREEYVGVTGPSLCLHDMKPRMVHREEHLFRNFVEMACCAMPIWAPSGALLGVIDSTYSRSGYAKSAYVSVMPLLAQLARRIEMKYFARNYQDRVILSVSRLNNYTDHDDEALFAINENGVIIAAEFALTKGTIGDTGGRLVGANVQDVFDVSLDKMLDDHHRAKKPRSRLLFRNAGGHVDLRVFSLPDKVPFRAVVNGILGNTPYFRDKASIQVHDSLLALSSDDAVVSENIRRIHKVLNKNISILLLGETGTGKDTLARAIHRASDRRDKPFVAINCAAIPESLIESELFGYEPGSFTGASRVGKQGKVMAANGGTLFLDEIGDMPAALQGRLLRVLEEREVTPLGTTKASPVDIRVISATNKSIDDLVQQGGFRTDLLYRINDVVLSLPPLRERSDKIRLVETICQQECGVSGMEISAEAWNILLGYSWPGNIRELRSVIRTALALSDGNAIRYEDLPERLVTSERGSGRVATPPTTPLRSDSDALERNRILAELERHRWRVTDTAKFLKISRNTLYRKMRLYGIMGADA
ncbi:sigma-54-dependent Fis family transcriptional regulator [Acidithiobacillus sp. M4-SHS-6]|uniref:sigma-54-dependent Fis family transcriptional regulator n=1 Tax=Acidithiobacillus sp. M4-SHS-6 TaxID=3383024 RepID=UPI0039BE02BB